jgi:hypothetical protein
LSFSFFLSSPLLSSTFLSGLEGNADLAGDELPQHRTVAKVAILMVNRKKEEK